MKNIHVLQTDKPSRLYSWENTLKITNSNIDLGLLYKNIYITCDEEIKDGDWCFYLGRFVAKIVCKAKLTDTGFVYQEFGEDYVGREDEGITPLKSEIFKIILTTDQDLIKDGVQAIYDEFLEWFVKNPSCEFVEVDKEEDELVSPKNPKIRFNYLQDPPSFISAESLNNMILTYKYKIIIPQEEPKQKTLEEAAANLADPNLCKTDNWIAGAKWQQENTNVNALNFEIDSLKRQVEALKHQKEQMYSEEEFLSFGKSCFYKGFEKSEKDDANCYTAFREEIGSIIEQFKNKKL
jgi:hypothetical protein